PCCRRVTAEPLDGADWWRPVRRTVPGGGSAGVQRRPCPSLGKRAPVHKPISVGPAGAKQSIDGGFGRATEGGKIRPAPVERAAFLGQPAPSERPADASRSAFIARRSLSDSKDFLK